MMKSRCPGRTICAALFVAMLLQVVAPLPAIAEESRPRERERLLRRLVFKEVEGGSEIRIEFNRPVRYVRHSPRNEGKIVRIEMAEAGPGNAWEDLVRTRESLQSTFGKKSPLLEVLHERAPNHESVRDADGEETAGQARLENLSLILRFRGTTQFEIRPDPKSRSLTVFTKNKERKQAASEVVVDPANASSRSQEILLEARRAMTASEYTRAAALFELVLASKPMSEQDEVSQRDAKELLGLARERNGQLAHARGEYEEYLAEYPEGEGSARVRQRLQALVTAASLPTQALREAQGPDDQPRFDIFGNAAVGYYRADDVSGDEDILDSRIITDFDVTARTDVKGYEVTGDLSLSHDHDFEARDASSEDLTRVILLSIEVEDPTRTYGGVIGRQTLRSSGVLGRFDGVVAHGQLDDHFTLNGVFGFPLERTTNSELNTDRIFFGSALDIDGYIEGLSAQLFGIGQFNQGLVDRVALGTEMSYVAGWGYTRSFLDYDAYFNELNLALVSSSVNIGEDTQLHTYLQTQTSPFLTASNALIGQVGARDLKDLNDDFSKSEIRKLAKARTARTYTATLGGSHWLDPELQLSLDVTYTKTGSTKATGSEGDDGFVAAVPSTDGEVSTNVRVTKNSLLFKGDISSASFRFSDGEVFRSYAALLRTRIPIRKGLYVDPRFSLTYRDRQPSGNTFADEDRLDTRTTAQLTWDWSDFRFEIEAGIISESFFGGPTPDELSYLAEALVRYEF